MISFRALLPVVVLFSEPAQGETLKEAIAIAYATNPELAEARARQEAREEAPEQERAQGRPTLSADAGLGYDRFDLGNAASANLTAVVPLWTGGRVSSAVRAAEADVAAGEQRLRDREAAVLERVVVAYSNVLFAQESVEVARIGIERLNRQIDEAQLRFELGESTLTDVAQLRTQRASVIANLADAEAAFESAVASYRAVVGQDPGELMAQVPPPHGLPSDLPAARAAAEANNPLLVEQRRIATSSAARIGLEKAARAPSLGLAGGYGRGIRLAQDDIHAFESAATVRLIFRIPILTGGLVSSRVREAEATYRAERFGVLAAARETIRSVDTAWASLHSARQRLAAGEAGLEAAELALNGVRAEYEFGLRSTVDILIAEQSYRDAQLAVARSRSDLLIAQAALLRTSGRLDRDAYL